MLESKSAWIATLVHNERHANEVSIFKNLKSHTETEAYYTICIYFSQANLKPKPRYKCLTEIHQNAVFVYVMNNKFPDCIKKLSA